MLSLDLLIICSLSLQQISISPGQDNPSSDPNLTPRSWEPVLAWSTTSPSSSHSVKWTHLRPTSLSHSSTPSIIKTREEFPSTCSPVELNSRTSLRRRRVSLSVLPRVQTERSITARDLILGLSLVLTEIRSGRHLFYMMDIELGKKWCFIKYPKYFYPHLLLHS